MSNAAKAIREEIATTQGEIDTRQAKIEKLLSALEVIEEVSGGSTKKNPKVKKGNLKWGDLLPYIKQHPGQTHKEILNGLFKGKHHKTKTMIGRRMHSTLALYKKEGKLVTTGEKGVGGEAKMKWYIAEKAE